MKKLLFIFLFASSSFASTLELNSLTNSNIDRVSNPVKTDVYSQTVHAKTKFKFRPKRKLILIDLPSLDLEYTPSLTEKVRSLILNNTLIGLYLPKRGLIYTGTVNANYTKSIFTNEDQEVEDSKNWSLGLDGGVAKDMTKNYNLGLNLGMRSQIYFKPANPNDPLPLKDDNLRFDIKVRQKYKINKDNRLTFDLKFQDKIFKEKRALNSKGDQVSTSPETIHNYNGTIDYTYKSSSAMIAPELGYTYNNDTIENGRTYSGLEYGLRFSYDFSRFNFNTRYSYKIRDYKTQLVDTVDTTGTSPLLKARIIGFYNSIEIPFGKKRQYQAILGYDYLGLKSNRKSDDNSNEIMKVGLRLNF